MHARKDSGMESGRKAMNMAGSILVAKLVSFVMLAAAFLIVVRVLGPGEYGIYTVAIAVSGFFGAIGGLGVSTAIVKFIPEYGARRNKLGIERTIADSMAILFIIGAVLTVAVFLLSGVLASMMHNPSYGPVIQVASLVVLLSTMFGAGVGALVGLGRGKHFAIATVAMTLVQSALAILLALTGFGALAPLIALIVAYAVGFAVAMLYVYRANSIRMVRPSRAGMANIIRFSWPLGLSGILTTLMTNLVPIVLGMFAAAFVLGNFGVISKVSYLMDIVIGSVSMALLPSFAGSFARGESKKKVGGHYSYSVHLSFVLLAPVFIAVIMLAQPVSLTAFSGDYTLAPLYVAIFTLGLLVSIFGVYAPQLLVGAGKVRQIIKYTLAVTAAQLAALPIAIPFFGGLGAVVLLYLLTPVLVDVFFMYAIRKEFQVRLWSPKLTRVCAANAAMAAILLPDMLLLGGSFVSMIVAAALVFAAYPPLVRLFGGIDARDIRLLNGMTERMPGIGAVVRRLTDYASMFDGRHA